MIYHCRQQVCLTATAQHSGSTVKIDKSNPINLVNGKAQAKIEVTAQDGKTKREYIINIQAETSAPIIVDKVVRVDIDSQVAPYVMEVTINGQPASRNNSKITEWVAELENAFDPDNLDIRMIVPINRLITDESNAIRIAGLATTAYIHIEYSDILPLIHGGSLVVDDGTKTYALIPLDPTNAMETIFTAELPNSVTQIQVYAKFENGFRSESRTITVKEIPAAN